MTRKIAVGKFVIDRDVNDAAVHQNLHSIGVFARQETQKFLDGFVTVGTFPIVLRHVRLRIVIFPRKPAEIDDVPRAINFPSGKTVTVIPMRYIRHTVGEFVVRQHRSHFVRRKSDHVAQRRVFGTNRIDAGIIESRENILNAIIICALRDYVA